MLDRKKTTFIKELLNGNYELCTEKQINEAFIIREERKKLETQVKELEERLKDCPHNVWYDEEGHIYYTRICVACGSRIGTI